MSNKQESPKEMWVDDMKRKIKKQNENSDIAQSNVVTPGEFLDKLMVAYPEEYKTAYEISKNVIISMMTEEKKTKAYSFEQYCYWFFLLDFADKAITDIRDFGIIDYHRQLHHTKQGVKEFNEFDDLF